MVHHHRRHKQKDNIFAKPLPFTPDLAAAAHYHENTNTMGYKKNCCTNQREYLPVAELKFMEAQCLIAGAEPGTAIQALEAILQFARTAEMNATLGRVYESSGLKRCAM